MQTLYCQERDAYIRRKFNGQSHEKPALAFGLSKSLIRRIVNGDK